MIDQELLKVLACPACRGEVECREESIVCTQCGLKFPVKDGIPVMLLDEAEA